MRTRRGVLVLGAAGVLGLAGCARDRAGDTVPEDAVPHGAEAGEPIDDVLDRWRRQRDANRPFGLAATASLDGEEMTVHTEHVGAAATVEAPCTISREGVVEGGLVGADVTVDGEAADTLVVHGSTLEVGSGTLRELSIEQVDCTDPLALHLEEKPFQDEPAAPDPPAESLDGSTLPASRYVGGPLESVELSGYESAYVFRDGERTDLSGPITVSASSVWIAVGTLVETGATTVTAEQFSVATPEGTAGTVAVDGRADVDDPYGVFGRDATLAVEPGHVELEESFRLTQAVTEEGFVLDSTVDVLPAATSISVPAGETKWVVVYYRERTYVGDGAFAEVTVDSAADGLVEVPVGPPKLLVQKVVESFDAHPVDAITLAAMAPGLVALAVGETLATIVDCVIDDCPDDQPYPAWIDAGSVGRFYYRIDATDRSPGTYEATARIEGANYGTLEVPVEVTVTEPTSSPTAEQ